MTREEYDNCSITEKIDLINKYMETLTEKKKELLDNSYYCNKCNQYFEKIHWGHRTEEELHKGICVFTDAGYGDDDEYADVTYKVYYLVCPYCGARKEFSKIAIKEENRRGRYGKLLTN